MLKESNLHNYQRKAISHILENTHAGLFLDMGLGKTVSTLTALDKLINEELDIDTALVVAPKRVVESVWKQETQEWEHLTHLKVSRIIGNPRQRKAALKVKANIYLISRDNIAWLCGMFGGQKLPFDMLVIDESSSFKNHKSVRFKALKMVQPSFKRVVILTGTPAPNGYIDLWPQIYLLDRGERLGKFIGIFRNNFFSPGATNGQIVYNYNIRQGGAERISEAIVDICISMKAKDYLELPERIDRFVYVDFPEKVQKAYNAFEKEKVLELMSEDAEEISAVSAAALSTKLRQYANGAIYDEERNYHIVHDLKLDALQDIIEGANGKPVLVAWAFRHDRDRILKRFKEYEPRELKKQKDVEAWNRGEVKVMIMHPASGGHGLNLQRGGNIIVWYGLTWSLELYQQFNARLHRQGQKQKTFFYHLVSRNTIDQRVIKALKSKDSKQESLLSAVKALVKKYVSSF